MPAKRRTLYIVLSMILTKFWDYCCFTAIPSPAGPITFRLIPVLIRKKKKKKTLVRPQLEYAAPTCTCIWHPYNETQTAKVEKVQKTAARWACRRWRNSSSVGDMLDELEWPSLQSRRERSSLTFFYKIHSGTVSLDKDKYLTPAPNLRRTRASHESQYTRQFGYSDALKNSLSPELFRFGIVSLLQWSHLTPLRNLRLLFNHRPTCFSP